MSVKDSRPAKSVISCSAALISELAEESWASSRSEPLADCSRRPPRRLRRRRASRSCARSCAIAVRRALGLGAAATAGGAGGVELLLDRVDLQGVALALLACDLAVLRIELRLGAGLAAVRATVELLLDAAGVLGGVAAELELVDALGLLLKRLLDRVDRLHAGEQADHQKSTRKIGLATRIF